MKKHNRILSVLLATFMLLFILTIPVSADTGDEPGHIVFGSSYILSSEQTLTGDLVIIGGSATIEDGAIVKGDVLIAGGTANIDGTIRGDITAFGGIVNILDDAKVTGDVVRYGGVFNLDEDARIDGNIVSNEGSDFNFSGDTTPPITSDTVNQIFEGPAYIAKQLGKFLWKIVQAIGLAMMGVILTLFLDKPLERMTTTLRENLALSIGIGLLTAIVFPILMVILIITILLIPVSLLGLIGFVLLTLYGWFALALLFGEKIAEIFKTEWTAPLNMGIGSLALSLISFLIGAVPCIGWMGPVIFASAGLGAVILSRGGMRVYTDENSKAKTPPAKQIPASSPAPQAVTPTETELKPLDLDAIPPEETNLTAEEGSSNADESGENGK